MRILGIGLMAVGVVLLSLGLLFGFPAYSRFQRVKNADNQVRVNAIIIRQTDQLVEVEKMKAQIRIEEAKGIAESQRIIDASLTVNYLQYLAIQAQMRMADSPNHTTVYIPSGTNGIPLIKDVDKK